MTKLGRVVIRNSYDLYKIAPSKWNITYMRGLVAGILHGDLINVRDFNRLNRFLDKLEDNLCDD